MPTERRLILCPGCQRVLCEVDGTATVWLRCRRSHCRLWVTVVVGPGSIAIMATA